MIKWDNDSFDRVVDNNGKPIKRIGNYVSYQSKIQMKCLKCEHEWSALPGNIITYLWLMVVTKKKPPKN